MANNRVLPNFDNYSDQNFSRDVERILDRKGFEQFCADFPDFPVTQDNVGTLVYRLNFYGVPCSRRNCGIVYSEMIADNAVVFPPEPEPESAEPQRDGIIRPQSTVKFNYTLPDTKANRIALSEMMEKFGEVCPVGTDPKKTDLKRQYRESLAANRERFDDPARPNLPSGWAEARMYVRHHNPSLRVDSAAFNAEVAKVLEDTAE
jgi:hypothetical protein